MNRNKNIAVLIAVSAMLQSCVLTDEYEDRSLNPLASAIQKACGFLPTIVSLAALFGAPGAPQGEKAVKLVCDAVAKAKAEKQAKKASQSGGSKLMSLDASVEPETLAIGTELTFRVNGKIISGLTTK